MHFPFSISLNLQFHLKIVPLPSLPLPAAVAAAVPSLTGASLAVPAAVPPLLLLQLLLL